jgi:formate dehydrogenase major subunit
MRLPALLRQLTSSDDRGGLAHTVKSKDWQARTATADRVVDSVCPYCAVGCGQKLYVKGERVVHIEGDPNSPISRGRLCPRGSSSLSLVNSPTRQTKALYRAPHATDFEEIDLEEAIDMIADRVIDTRARTWEPEHRRTLGFAHLGGATLDNEENYLLKKGFSALGAIQIENQARI